VDDDDFALHRERRATFDAAVDAYETGRPGYPDAVFDHLEALGALRRGGRTLEIGPGTGQATVELLRRAGPLTAIELGHDLATRLVEKIDDPRLRVVEGAFEAVDLGDERYDLVAAATSFHWVPPAAGLARVADLLAPDGWVALWWNCFGDPDRADPFQDALVPVLREHAPELMDVASAGSAAAGHWYALDVAARVGEIDATGRFGPVVVERVR